ncbi:MAG: RHS repeat protein, partial [Acidobacteria bacterium]|nr:RHS repeat protein [Acidobacteriota bacterium]
MLSSLAPAAPALAGLPPEDVQLHDGPGVARPDPPTSRGKAPFRVTAEGGDCTSSCNRDNGNGLNAGDPVSANTGAYHFDLPLLSLGGPMNLGFTLRYRSDFNQVIWAEALPTRFWWSPWEDLEWEPSLYATFQISNGDAISFAWKTDHWEPGAPFVPGVYPVPWSLQETDGYFYLMDPIGEQVHIFKKINLVGRIERIVDRNGNQLIYSYATDNTLYPSRVEDGLGRSLDFTYQTIGRWTALVRVTDQAGRQVNLTYEEQGADNDNVWTLRAVTDPTGQTTTFHYTWKERDDHLVKWHHQITAVERPAGNIPYTQAYEMRELDGSNASRVISQTDAYSHTTAFTYDPAAVKVTENRPDGTTQVYEHYGFYSPPQALTDPTGKVIQFGRDAAHDRLTSVTDRLGDATQVTYHPETGKIASYTGAEGNTTVFTYTAQDQTFTNPANGETVTFTFYNLIRVDYPDGTHEEFAYDAHGNVLTHTDRVGKAWHYTYNSRGQLLTLTNPEGGVVTHTYNADATLASSTDSDMGLTTYAYDGYKRLNRITRPDASTVQFTYDLNNRLLTFTDELGHVTTFTYDANENLDTATNPLGQTTTYAQDLMDRLTGVADPLGHSSAYAYDSMNRLASFTDRNGNTITYAYDDRGWLTGATDPLGHTWTTAYDDEGVPTAFTTPLGRTTSYQSDNLGRITRLTDPLGHHTDWTYDALGRLISRTDRMGRTTGYDYDDAGRLVGVTGPVIGTATYTRNDLGLLTRITDLRGKHWDFGYSPMGRLTSHTDPLGRQWTYAYDERGRLQQITYPDGSSATYTYDAAGRVTQIAYPGGPTLNYTYDDAGRLLTANDIALTYDARGDITDSRDGGASFGATYDEGRRLQTVTYDGQATVIYTYDERNLLTRVEDSLSGAWLTFSYDDDGRLTALARSNGVTSIYTYDAAGRMTRIQDVGARHSQTDFALSGGPPWDGASSTERGLLSNAS